MMNQGMGNMGMNNLMGTGNMGDMNMMNAMGGMGDMNMMNAMGGMNNMNMMNAMGGMDNMDMMNAMGGMNNINMMNAMGGMNNLNMMNPMGGMNMMNQMNGMNMMNTDSVNLEDNKGWNLIFENQNDRQTVNIKISENKLVKEAINLYKLKSNRTKEKLKFVFNNKELFQDMRICQSGLNNMSKILVISLQNLKGAK